MPEESPPEHARVYIDPKLMQWLSRIEIPPTAYTKLADSFQTDLVRATLDRLAADVGPDRVLVYEHDLNLWLNTFSGDNRLPVPTTQELQETEHVLRERVLPEISEEELQQAVEEIPADPEKVKLAAFLINVMQRAVSVSPTPYAVFVIVFWIAMRMNAPEAAAAALAFIVMQDYRNRHGG